MSNQFNEKMVARVARLAHIALSVEEERELAAELGQVLDWIDQLNEVDTDSVPSEVLSSTASGAFWDILDLPEKEPAESYITVEDALKNAPESQGGFFVTPKTNE